jgi:transposase
MIGLAHHLKIYACIEPTDMRKSFDGLSGIVANLLAEDPLSGHLFLFRNRSRDRLKILYWDRDGLAIWYKRLEKGTFQFPTDLVKDSLPSGKAQITTSQLALLLGGVELASVRHRKRYALPEIKK